MVVALSTFRLLCNHHHHFQNSLHPAKLKLYAHHSGTSILLPSSPAACILLAVSADLLLEVSHGGSHTQSVSLWLSYFIQHDVCTVSPSHRSLLDTAHCGIPSLYSLKDAPLYTHNTRSYLSNSQWTPGLLPCFSYREESCYELEYTIIPLGFCFRFFWACTQKWKCWVIQLLFLFFKEVLFCFYSNRTFCIPTISVQGFWSLHILTNPFWFWWLLPWRCEAMSHSGFNRDAKHPFMCLCPLVCLLWRNVYSSPSLISESGYFFVVVFEL